MNAPWYVLAAWSAFAGTHLLLGLPPWRDRLARALGEQRFVAVFSAVAAAMLAVLGAVVAIFGGDGPAGAALGSDPAWRLPLGFAAWLGLVLATAGLLNYMRSPMALFRTELRPVAGIERITRHAFFVGLALFAIAHALLASTAAVALYFAGFALLSLAGAVLQDRKLLRRYGDAYAGYLAVTSLLPFVAIARGRQRLRRGEGLLRRLLIAAVVAALLAAMHPLWAAYHGAPLAGVIAFGGVFASARRWRLAQRIACATRVAAIAPLPPGEGLG